MTKLAQILAIEDGARSRAKDTETRAHHLLQKAPLLAGLSRTYLPTQDDGQELPPESTRVQVSTRDEITKVTAALTRAWDLAATKDEANTEARGDVVVGGRTLLTQVPVTTLLWLEKALTDVRTFVVKLPTLDPSDVWVEDVQNGGFRAEPSKTIRTKKVPRRFVKYEATEQHPAQVDIYMEDVPEGTWTTVKFSGALPAAEVAAMTERIDAVLAAVKSARAAANDFTVTDHQVGAALLAYVFDGATQNHPA